MTDGPNLELVLAQQANEAMAAGADPREVTERLRHLIEHVRSNPELMRAGTEALAQGADPSAITGRVYQLAQEAGRIGHGASRSFGDEPVKQAPADFAETMLHGIPFAAKIKAGTDAALDKASGQGGFVDQYNKRLEDRNAAVDEYRHEHKVKGTIATLAGAAAPALATLGGSTAAQGTIGAAERVPMLARMAQGARIGAAYGGVQGLSEGHGSFEDYKKKVTSGVITGGIGGSVMPVVGKGVGYVANKLGLPDLASKGLSKLADVYPQKATKLRRLAQSFGTKGKAAEELGKRVEQDEAAGFTPKDEVQGVPLLGLDRMGPSVEGLAENIAQRPGSGRSTIIKALTERSKTVRPAVSNAFDKGTGTTQESGEALLQKMADEHAALEKAGTIRKTLATEDRASARVRQTPPNVLAAWRDELGGTFTNGIRALRQAIADKNATAAEAFGAARAAHQGQPLETPTLNALRQTPIGRMAENWALVQKANRMRNLPTVSEPDEATISSLLAMGLPADKAAQFGGTVERDALDAETVHFMKQFLAKASRLGMRDGQGGTIATQAQGALNVWGRIRDELPEAFRHADEVTAARFRIIDALNQGRDLMRSQLNPSGNKAIHTSIDAIAERVGEMTAQEQQAFRIGAQSSITDYLRTAARSPDALAIQLNEPTSALSRRIVLATGDAGAPSRLASRLARQQTLVQTVTPPPVMGMVPSTSQAASRGLDLLRHGEAAPSAAPERSLAVLERSVGGMGPAERSAFREGAAQSLRGEFAGSRAKAPGSVFARSPERVRQVRQAFPDSKSSEDFQKLIGAFDDVAARDERILGNSRTGTRVAEEASRAKTRPGGLIQAARHPVQAVNGLLNGAEDAAVRTEREAVDSELARLLTSAEPDVLSETTAAARLRELGRIRSRKVLAATAGGAAANR